MRYEPVVIRPPSKPPKTMDRPLLDISSTLDKFEDAVRTLEASQRGVLRRFQEILETTEALGTAYNGFSLEYAALASLLDQIGELHDGAAESFSEVLASQQVICETINGISKVVTAIKRVFRNYSARLAEYETLSERANQARSGMFLPESHRTSPTDLQIAEFESLEKTLGADLAQIRRSLTEQLSVWLGRSRLAWDALLQQVSSAEKKFSTQGLQQWERLQAVE